MTVAATEKTPVVKKNLFSPVKSFGTVKSLGNRQYEGLGIRFGTAAEIDSYGDYFTQLTETGLWNGSDRPFLMEHWENELFSWKIVGRAVYEKQETGWAYVVTITDDDAGELAASELDKGDYRSSTGSAWNYTRGIYTSGDAYMLTTWLVIEQSATKKPADYWNPPIQIKSLADYDKISAIIAPLLAERESDLFNIQRIESEWQGKFLALKAEVEQVKNKFEEQSVESGITLPAEIEDEVGKLLAEFDLAKINEGDK